MSAQAQAVNNVPRFPDTVFAVVNNRNFSAGYLVEQNSTERASPAADAKDMIVIFYVSQIDFILNHIPIVMGSYPVK